MQAEANERRTNECIKQLLISPLLFCVLLRLFAAISSSWSIFSAPASSPHGQGCRQPLDSVFLGAILFPICCPRSSSAASLGCRFAD
jgi:hypothetical protein